MRYPRWFHKYVLLDKPSTRGDRVLALMTFIYGVIFAAYAVFLLGGLFWSLLRLT